MFRKQFTQKSSINLRHSERKTIFPANINACFNAKQQFVRLTVSLAPPAVSGAAASNLTFLFVHNKEPLFFQCQPSVDGTIFPTVYFLWSAAFNGQFPVLFVHATVWPMLQNGSDLMIPGILLDPPFTDFEANAPVAIALIGDSTVGRGGDGDNQQVCLGPVAVGQALISSTELRTKRHANSKGKAVKILHLHGDFVWEFGSRKPIPKMAVAATTDGDGQGKTVDQPQQQQAVHQEQGGQPGCSASPPPLLVGADDEPSAAATLAPDEQQNVQAQMDELLKNTFFTALRWKFGPNGPLPIDAGQFYANYILKSLPPGSKLEIKKTRFKKFSTFLRELSCCNDENGWVLRLKSIKGMDTIEEINHNHPLIQAAPEPVPNANAASSGAAYGDGPLLSVQENMYSLTERVMPIFRPYGFSKGDIVDLNRIRAVLLDYAQKKNLCRNDGKHIELDDTLQPVVQHFLHEQFDVNKLVQKCASATTPALVVITKEGKQLVHRGPKGPHIDMKIEKRAGNKVVTLVSNLAMFGINVTVLDSAIRGTGTSILASAPACEGPQLMVQGNEINRIGRLLTEFGVPKKFINGLDQGIKEPKKKKK